MVGAATLVFKVARVVAHTHEQTKAYAPEQYGIDSLSGAREEETARGPVLVKANSAYSLCVVSGSKC